MRSLAASTTLFEDLKDWRKRMAQELQKPIFLILNNGLIEEVAVKRPKTLGQLSELSGMGPKKLFKYGRTILNLVEKHEHDEEIFNLEAISERNKAIEASDASFWAAQKKAKPKKPKKEKPGEVAKAEQRRKKRIEMLSDSALAELKWPEIALSDLNAEQQDAAAHILSGSNVFLTGSAGTGKTFLLRYVIQELEKRFKEPGEVAVTAPTGIAAINIGGQTIHSFSGIGLGKLDILVACCKVETVFGCL
jgi:ATP-dependent DNA helicase PIF1